MGSYYHTIIITTREHNANRKIKTENKPVISVIKIRSEIDQHFISLYDTCVYTRIKRVEFIN
jgi:hypothetical protein